MKKYPYFTPETIRSKALEMLSEICAIRRDRGGPFILENSTLIIIDMQEYFLDPQSHAYVPSAIAIKKNILELANFFKSKNLPILGTQHIDSDNSPMIKWWSNSIDKNSSFSLIDKEIASFLNSVIIKTSYDSFFDTNLDSVLKQNKCKSLIITGIQTHLCCETTARSAFIRGYDVFLPVDATASYNEEFHKASMLSLGHGFASIITTDTILKTCTLKR